MGKKVWVHARFKLVDPEHKKPDRKKAIIFSIAVEMSVIEEGLKAIEEIINDGYIISEMWVTSG